MSNVKCQILHLRHSAGEFRHVLHHAQGVLACHHLHHLARLFKLFDEFVYLLDIRATSLGDTHTPTGIQQSRVVSFLGSHAEDDGFDILKGIVIDVDVLQCFAYTGNH